MKEKKRIVDTTLRDGEQSPFVYLSSADKISIASQLDKIGVYQIESGVSVLGINEQKTIYKIMENRKNTKISVWSRLNPNDIKKSIECCPDIIHISIPVSYLHIYTKLGKNKPWILKQLAAALEIVAASNCKLSIGFEDASRADLSFIIKIIEILEIFGTEVIRLADTVGGAPPFVIRNMVSTVKEFTKIPIEIHAHNDLGMAAANTVEALKSGALYADTTILGIGERSGNCDMIYCLRLSSLLFDFGIDLEEAYELEENFIRIINSRKQR